MTDEAAGPSETVGPSIARQLRSVTVRLRTTSPDGGGIGTGFFFDIGEGAATVPCVITNKHVIKDATSLSLTMSVNGPDNMPMPGPGKEVTVGLDGYPIVYHPTEDVDLVAIPINPILAAYAQVHGVGAHRRSLNSSLIPTSEQAADLDALLTVTVIGYPDGLVDFANNAPILRRGITATAFELDYRGHPEFLIDMAIFPGSSGSPVMLIDEGSFSTRSGLSIGTRVHLLGVVFATHVHNEQGEVHSIPAPTGLVGTFDYQQNVHLGLCVRADQIVGLESGIAALVKAGK